MVILDNEVRREIVLLLAERAHSAGDIAEALGRSRSGISQHLAQLLAAHLVQCEKRGPLRIYSLNPAATLAAWNTYVERGS